MLQFRKDLMMSAAGTYPGSIVWDILHPRTGGDTGLKSFRIVLPSWAEYMTKDLPDNFQIRANLEDYPVFRPGDSFELAWPKQAYMPPYLSGV